MKNLVIYLFILLPHIAGAASDADLKDAHLFEVMGMARLHSRNLEKLIELKFQAQPELKKYETDVREIFDEELSWRELEPTALATLERNFTPKELEELKRFYSTQTGRKALEIMPKLLADVIEIGRSVVDERIAKFLAEKTQKKKK